MSSAEQHRGTQSLRWGHGSARRMGECSSVVPDDKDTSWPWTPQHHGAVGNMHSSSPTDRSQLLPRSASPSGTAWLARRSVRGPPSSPERPGLCDAVLRLDATPAPTTALLPGTLSLKLQLQGAEETVLWTQRGSQGSVWHRGLATLPATGQQRYRVRARGVRCHGAVLGWVSVPGRAGRAALKPPSGPVAAGFRGAAGRLCG